MDSFETKLYKASAICCGHFKYLDEFSKMYTFCTENVSGYMKHFDFDGKRLLTVGSSGDQVLNFFFMVQGILLYLTLILMLNSMFI